jgi:hypothetical protein
MSSAEASTPALDLAELPSPPSERRAWLLAGSLAALGVAVLIAALTGAIGRTAGQALPLVPARATVPRPGPAAAAGALSSVTGRSGTRQIVSHPSAAQQSLLARRLAGATQVHIARRWMEGFYPIYGTAQSTFGVNWLLLASIHMQESAFSTAPGTYHGLNFARCCGGPMQFNVTNGSGRGVGGRAIPSTWDLVANSYIYGRRPAGYDHMTAVHPSIYDDFDAIMAGAHLLSADGAGYRLDAGAWAAAYDYYGHDATGVLYADQVLARAIGWSQHGFCINCGVDASLLSAVGAAYGAPVQAALEAEAAAAAPKKATKAPRRRQPST